MLSEATFILLKLKNTIIPQASLDWPLQWPFVSVSFYTILSLISGSCIVEKLTSDINHFGIGEGPNLIICFEIVIELIFNLIMILKSFLAYESNTYTQICIVILVVVTTFYFAIRLYEITDIVPLKYSESKTKKISDSYINYLGPFLPIKWIKQGSLILLFTNIIFQFFRSIFNNLKFYDKIYEIFFNSSLAAVSIGIIVGIFQVAIVEAT